MYCTTRWLVVIGKKCASRSRSRYSCINIATNFKTFAERERKTAYVQEIYALKGLGIPLKLENVSLS